ncbi:hypothetical protein OfM2_20310 [Lactovum odontotermitis]
MKISRDYDNVAHELARKAHVGQVDKAAVDYIRHPETVAGFVSSDEEKAAAYLFLHSQHFPKSKI